jgi:2',3'-cyclic-nucleotide 2'-phosphodiesterase (5'-nucleotidase family)
VGRSKIAGPRLAVVAVALALLAAGACRRAAPAPRASVAPPRPAPAEAGGPVPPPPRGEDLALVYTSNLLGHSLPCDCAVRPLGGLARRATVIGRARAGADATLVVDAGDLFAGTERPPEARRFAAAVAAGGLDAFTPGERDLALGAPALERLAAHGLPILSSNLTDRSGKRLFPGERVFHVAGLRVGIFGVSAPPTPADAARWQAAGIQAGDAGTAARDAIQALRRQGAQLVIGLFHVGAPATARRLVGGLAGLDWAVLGHSGLNLEMPEQAGTARLLEAFSEGKNVGRLDLHVVGGGLSFADVSERPMLEAILADHRRQLGQYDRSLGGLDPAALEDYYRQRRAQLEAAIGRETAALARLPRAITGSWFENRIVPLDATVPDDPRVSGLVRRLDPHL